MRPLSCLFTATLLTAAATTAAAQPSGAAESLFREGKTLMAAGKIPEACAAFEGSYRKDPATSTLLNVADCREKNGQFATAWVAFIEVERRSRGSSDPSQQAINQLSQDRASRLESRRSFLTISVPDEARVEGLAITRDGESLDAAEWNTAIPADIGQHVVEAKALGYEKWVSTIEITAEKEQRAVTVPRFKPLPKEKLLPSVIRLIEPSPFTPKRKLGLGLAVGGVVGIGAGVAFYVLARRDYGEAEDTIDDGQQKELWELSNQKLLIAQIAGGIGVAALGTAAVLWFTGGPTVSGESALAVTPTFSPPAPDCH